MSHPAFASKRVEPEKEDVSKIYDDGCAPAYDRFEPNGCSCE